MKNNFVLPFSKLSMKDTGIAGGKGASLGEMTRAGIPVPPGFVVLTKAFETYIEETNIDVEIDAALDKVNHNEVQTIETASEIIHSLIERTPIPDSISHSVVESFHELQAMYVAVRSSATSEDSASAAWAGELDSFLNTTEETVLQNVKKCWASLFSPRAIFYRFEKNMRAEKVSVAVVVQKMVEREIAGVAFSVHPITQDKNQVLIEAGYGLGEGVVSGQVTPDSFVLDKRTMELLDKTINRQEQKMVRLETGGNEWQGVTEDKQKVQKIRDEQVVELAKIILNIENHYKFPCDIEWAMENDEFFVVQSRPITTLGNDDVKTVSGTLFNTAKALIKKYDIHPPFIHKGFHAKFYPIDFVQLIWNKWGEYSDFYYKLHISTLHNDYWDLYYFPEEFTALRNHYFAHIEKDKNYLQRHYQDWQESCRRLQEKINVLDVALTKTDFSKVESIYKDFVEEYIFEYALAAPIQEACGFQPEQWITPELEEYVKKYSLDYHETVALLTSPIVLSFITEEEIDHLQLAIKSKTSSVDELVKEHQGKYFWVQNNYADIQMLSVDFFREKVSEATKLSASEIEAKIHELKTSPAKTQQKKKDLLEKHHPSPLLKKYVEIVEKFAEMQDVRKSFVLRANHYHKLFLERVGQEFSHPLDNLWFYSWGELMKAISTKTFLSDSEIKKRKEMIAAVESKNEKIILSGSEANFLYSQLQEDVSKVTTFSGLVAQVGKAQGKVKIVLKSEDVGKVLEGDILVSSMTRPEMTPAMKKAAAFITDEGGITSHAAIIARELRKPCIIGTKIATKVLHDGDEVEINADENIVSIIRRATA